MPSLVVAVAVALAAVVTPPTGPTAGGTSVRIAVDRWVFAEVSVGEQHTVALANDGTVWAWGDNSVGQLGDGSTSNSLVPAPVIGLEGLEVVQVDAGYSHSVALTTDGRVFTWGYGFFGQLGNGQSTGSQLPIEVPASVFGNAPIRTVDAGPYTTTAITTDGTAFAWGRGLHGELGDGAAVNRNLPVAVDTAALAPGERFVDVSSGYEHAVAATDQGRVLAWGSNVEGQVGNGTTDSASTPQIVDLAATPAGSAVVDVEAGAFHNLALDEAGRAIAWGSGSRGQLGNGLTESSTVPVAVSMLDAQRFTDIGAGFEHSVAVASDGAVFAWGDNGLGQLGDAAVPGATVPGLVPVGPDRTQQVSAGWESTTALGTDGVPRSWGYNSDGQAGSGTTESPIAATAAVMPEADASFGGIPATDVVWLDEETLSAVTPAHPSGAVDVLVGQGGNARYPRNTTVLQAGFTYGTAPVVQQSPTSTQTTAAATVTLTGRGTGDEAPEASWQELTSAGWTDVAVEATTTMTDQLTHSTLVVTAPAEGGTARYRVLFSNRLGSATSQEAQITVPRSAVPPAEPSPPAPLQEQPSGQADTDGIVGSDGPGIDELAETGAMGVLPLTLAALAAIGTGWRLVRSRMTRPSR